LVGRTPVLSPVTAIGKRLKPLDARIDPQIKLVVKKKKKTTFVPTKGKGAFKKTKGKGKRH
jgi:YbbR domain-containing protein